MSLKCSVFGHRFDETEVTREREEQGSEVVITITETETCERCGDTRVVSENKEVTTLETPSDIVGDDPDEDDGTDGMGSPDDPAPADEPAPTEGAEATPQGAQSTGEATVTAPDSGEGYEDDAVILDDEDEDDEAGTIGEWPGEEGDDWTLEESSEELRPVAEEQPDGALTGEASTVPDGEFHCPECGFTTPVESSSLREGDFCPECHRGALAHQSGEQ